ncbi:cytoplasmic tRNA 2-thiolation protein 2 [Palaemon carinicauda]|uniref:cytoplasmic tRNA 2-thiolation protein 2 n=1 Tax=Palaemon carinicauda TaxID=392227 RepID=UPI0035B64977
MCSVDPDEIVEMTRATGGLDLSSGNVTCRKCNTEKAVVVLRMKDAYCRECFLSYFVHKFRSTIGKSKQIRLGDQILIATSGGVSSSALLHLVREGLDESSHKKLRFEPACLYIDESCLSDDSPDAGPEFVQQVCNRVLSRKFPCYVISLEHIMSSQPPVPTLYIEDGSAELSTSLELKEQLRKLLSSCKTDSAKQDLLEQLRRELLCQCAGALGYSKIFLADNATSLSVSILSNVALGRGSQLSDRVHFKARHKDIEIYRPMRELLQNEIHYYNDLHEISTVEAPSFKHKGSSIISCTEQFVMGLQKEFPATIPTIFRTGDKLVSTSTEMSKCSTPELNDHIDTDFSPIMLCVMCGLQLDTLQSESSAVQATIVSQRLSRIVAPTTKPEESVAEDTNCSYDTSSTSNIPPQEHSLDNVKSNNGCTVSSNGVGTNSCDCSQQTCCSSSKDKALLDANNSVPKDILDGYLCYGCRIIVRELEEVNRLPIKVRGSVAEQERRKHMREQIQDFLL